MGVKLHVTFCIHLKCWNTRDDSGYTSTATPTMVIPNLLAISQITGSKKLDTTAHARLSVKAEPVFALEVWLEILFFCLIAIIFWQMPSSAQSISMQTEPMQICQNPLEASKEEEKSVVPVVFPALLPQVVPAPTRIAMPSVAAPSVPAPNATPKQIPQSGRVNVSIMKGEVHMRNLNQKMATGEILSLSTGDRSSCEFKLNGATGRLWQNSDATVFAGSNLVMLNDGELVVSVRHSSGGEFTVISGDLLCRVRGTTIRVSRHQGHVKFSVLEGSVTVYNRQTGEVLKVSP